MNRAFMFRGAKRFTAWDAPWFEALQHGFKHGNGPIQVCSIGVGASLPMGMSAGTDYWAVNRPFRRYDPTKGCSLTAHPDHFGFASSPRNALDCHCIEVTTPGNGVLLVGDQQSIEESLREAERQGWL